MLDLHPFLLYCGERKKEDKKRQMPGYESQPDPGRSEHRKIYQMAL